MYVLSISDDINSSNQVDDLIKNKKHVFILVYMEGCGPCNATRPEWSKMSSTLKHQYEKNNDVVIVDINKDLLPSVKHIGSIEGFPTMKYITNNGNKIETYEDSTIKNKDRSSDSFINWVESKILRDKIISETPMSSSQNVYRRIRKSHSNTNTNTNTNTNINTNTNRGKLNSRKKNKNKRRRKSIRKRLRK
jgi:hypothetical protein